MAQSKAHSMDRTPAIDRTPDALLEEHIATAAARHDPIPIDSDEGRKLYRTLAQHVWRQWQRPVLASDIRDLWDRIDTLKRNAPANYQIGDIHFWAADYVNSLNNGGVDLDAEGARRLAAWLDDWPNVCILGHSGRGKSTTVNRLFGTRMADISHHEACTRSVSDYRLVTGSFLNRPTGIVLWDVPGFGDEKKPFDEYEKLYRRLSRRCDVVVYMLDNERGFHLDMKMFAKLKKRVPSFQKKLVIAMNKADLFHPYDWDEASDAPSERMLESIARRADSVTNRLALKNESRVVPLSALHGWNINALLSAMVDAAGESKGASLLRAVKRRGEASPEDVETARRFGVEVAPPAMA